jgi:hypothetical protein
MLLGVASWKLFFDLSHHPEISGQTEMGRQFDEGRKTIEL